MDGAFFAEFIKAHFNLCFGKAGPKTYGRRLFVMERVLHCFESFYANMIDRIIDSMPKRIEKIISSKGKRINY